jgi:hypothetical protein
MAKKSPAKKSEPQGKPAKPQVPARLITAVRTLLEDADDTGYRHSVVIGATAYNALRDVFHDLTGQWWGMEVEELDDEEPDDVDVLDDDEEDEEDEQEYEDDV